MPPAPYFPGSTSWRGQSLVPVGRAHVLPVAILALGLVAAGGPEPCEAGAHRGAPVVLISIDTLRSDRLPMYGYEGVQTPFLDSLRRDSILFERAYAHYPLTLPSHVSLLTGKLPPEHGVRDNVGYRLAEGLRPYLPRLLQEAGYATGATVSSYALRGALGLSQGFDFFDDRMEVEDAVDIWGSERFGSSTLAAACGWLDKVDKGPFFLFFHLYEPHLPYRPREPFLSRWGETYEGEIAAADAVVGALLEDLKARGLYDRSLIVFLSDHGEGLMDHDEQDHGVFLYREAIQVPLLVKLPQSHHGGRSVSVPARLIDVLPTVVEVLGLEEPEGVSGASLLELLAPDPPSREVFAETFYPRIHLGWSDLASLIDGRFHYIEGPDPELYDLDLDPGETRNVLREERAALAHLRKRIKSYRAPLELPIEEDEETIKRLEALGYLATSHAPASDRDLPDPKHQVAHFREKMTRAFETYAQGDCVGAIPLLHELLEGNSLMADVWEKLGTCYRETGKYERSLNAYGKAMELRRGSAQTAYLAGRVLLLMGRLEEAGEHAELAAMAAPSLARDLRLEIALAAGKLDVAVRLVSQPGGQETRSDLQRRLGLALAAAGRHQEAVQHLRRLAQETDDAVVHSTLALVLAEAGKLAEAAAILDRVVKSSPESAMARETRGLVALRQGRVSDARDDLERAVGLDDKLTNSWNLLGVARIQLEDVEGALEAWERAVELDSRQLDALLNLGLAAAQAGRIETAREALSRYLEIAPKERFSREITEVRELLSRMGAEG